jgi:hypothetical protein
MSHQPKDLVAISSEFLVYTFSDTAGHRRRHLKTKMADCGQKFNLPISRMFSVGQFVSMADRHGEVADRSVRSAGKVEVS